MLLEHWAKPLKLVIRQRPVALVIDLPAEPTRNARILQSEAEDSWPSADTLATGANRRE
jgi:hypothetical protein